MVSSLRRIRIAQDGVDPLSCNVDIDNDLARFHARLDAVVNGVFEQRLQQQRRDERVRRHIVDVPDDFQPVAESQLLDLEVLPAQLDLFRNRRKLALVAHSDSKKLREVLEYHFCPLGILTDQGQDGIQTVEQEVRSYAGLQRL